METNGKRFLFVAFVCVFLLSAFSCATRRNFQATTSTMQTDTTRTIRQTDTTANVRSCIESSQSKESATGKADAVLTIDRDSSGLPTRYTWHGSFNSNFYGSNTTSGVSNSTGYSASTAEDSKSTRQEDKETETKEELSAGVPLEKYIGVSLLFVMVLYVIYVMLADGIRKNRYL